MIVDKNTTINEILHAYPEAMKFFNEKQMACGGCFAVKFDTLENGALMHGMEVSALISQLEQFLQALPMGVFGADSRGRIGRFCRFLNIFGLGRNSNLLGTTKLNGFPNLIIRNPNIVLWSSWRLGSEKQLKP